MRTQSKISFLLLFAALALFMVSCSKEGTTPDEPTISTNNTISNFSFTKANNSSLTENCQATLAFGNQFWITVPEGVDLTSLVPTFSADSKATVKIGANTIQSEGQPVDFSKTVTIEVTSESGSTRTYMVLVKNGNTKVDKMVYSFMIEHEIPGVSIAISKDEQTVYTGAYGFANKLTHERVTSNHMFRLASMSKQHTAIAIMHLKDKGKLELTDTVFGKDGLLYKAYGDNMSSDWKAVTVAHLLSHTSGLFTEGFFGAGSAFSGKSLDQRINIHLSSSLGATPGAVYEYNNSNFAILGKIVEVVSGKKFIDYLKEDVYGPNGITGIDCATNDDPIKGEVVHYTQTSIDPYANNVEVGVAAGGIVANAPGLMQLMARIDYATEVKDILKKETLDEMYKAINVVDTDGDSFNQYALGWRKNHKNHPTFEAWHGGTLAGVCPVWARTTDNVNGVILCNSRSDGKSIDSDMRYLLEDIQDVFRK